MNFVSQGLELLPQWSIMTDYEIYSFEAFRTHRLDDRRPVGSAEISYLDIHAVEKYIMKKRENRPGLKNVDDETVFGLMGITAEGKPTLASILVFGIYPQAIFPQLCATAIRVAGREIGDVNTRGDRFIDNVRLEGTIPELFDGIMNFCKRAMRNATRIDPETGYRNDRAEYPVEAIREAVLNALIHRDYSPYTEGTPIQIDFFEDRLEIHSPGSLYGGMEVDQLGIARPDLRNPLLATMCEFITVAENRFSGIPTMRKSMSDYGLPEPEFRNCRNEFVVVFWNTPVVNISENVENQRIISPYANGTAAGEGNKIDVRTDTKKGMILEFCKQPHSKKEIADFLGIQSYDYVYKRYILPLVNRGMLVRTIPERPRSRSQRYVTAGSRL